MLNGCRSACVFLFLLWLVSHFFSVILQVNPRGQSAPHPHPHPPVFKSTDLQQLPQTAREELLLSSSQHEHGDEQHKHILFTPTRQMYLNATLAMKGKGKEKESVIYSDKSKLEKYF